MSCKTYTSDEHDERKAMSFMSKNWNVSNDKSAILIMHCVMIIESATIGIVGRRRLENFFRLIPGINLSLSKLLNQPVIPKFNTASLKHRKQNDIILNQLEHSATELAVVRPGSMWSGRNGQVPPAMQLYFIVRKL